MRRMPSLAIHNFTFFKISRSMLYSSKKFSFPATMHVHVHGAKVFQTTLLCVYSSVCVLQCVGVHNSLCECFIYSFNILLFYRKYHTALKKNCMTEFALHEEIWGGHVHIEIMIFIKYPVLKWLPSLKFYCINPV